MGNIIRMGVLKKNEVQYFQDSTVLPKEAFDVSKITNVVAGFIIQESTNNMVGFREAQVDSTLGGIPALQFTYKHEAGMDSASDTYWVSGSITTFLTKANASTGGDGAAAGYDVALISPYT